MKIVDRIALILVVIGALNWGSVGLFSFDCVAFLFGGQTGAVSLAGTYATPADLTARLNRSTDVHAADTAYTTYMARGEALFAQETTPTVNGAIAWQYE